jgi:hypothetical protein
MSSVAPLKTTEAPPAEVPEGPMDEAEWLPGPPHPVWSPTYAVSTVPGANMNVATLRFPSCAPWAPSTWMVTASFLPASMTAFAAPIGMGYEPPSEAKFCVTMPA